MPRDEDLGRCGHAMFCCPVAVCLSGAIETVFMPLQFLWVLALEWNSPRQEFYFLIDWGGNKSVALCLFKKYFHLPWIMYKNRVLHIFKRKLQIKRMCTQ